MTDRVHALCSRCSETSAYPAEWAGTTQECTHCGAYVDIPTRSGALFEPRPDRNRASSAALDSDADGDEVPDGASIAMICPFCDESAEFDASAAGTPQPCPNCGETLDVLGSLVVDRRAQTPIFFRCDGCNGLIQTDPPGAASGCLCPRCAEPNDPDAIAKNRLTSGQVERLGLLPDPRPRDEG